MAAQILTNKRQKQEFVENSEVDTAYSLPGIGRFRCNIFRQRGSIGIVLRAIPIGILSIRDLGLPPVLEELSLEPRGLILVTGITGSGKSTTLAAMIEHINAHIDAHIITIEDPIEFLHRDKRSLVNQREVGSDTQGFHKALRSALRQDPDVILVGEMRDQETMATAITAAQTGHLVMSTLHTSDAMGTINRILSLFPPHQNQQVRLELAEVLKGIVSMRLVRKADGKGRVPAVEVLIITEIIRECIVDPTKTFKIPDLIAAGASQYGMQTFDQALMKLLQDGLISYDEALLQSTKPSDFALKVKGIQSTEDTIKEKLAAEQAAAKEKLKRPQTPSAGFTRY
jgi:twitching motility protein PilT